MKIDYILTNWAENLQLATVMEQFHYWKPDHLIPSLLEGSCFSQKQILDFTFLERKNVPVPVKYQLSILTTFYHSILEVLLSAYSW